MCQSDGKTFLRKGHHVLATSAARKKEGGPFLNRPPALAILLRQADTCRQAERSCPKLLIMSLANIVYVLVVFKVVLLCRSIVLCQIN